MVDSDPELAQAIVETAPAAAGTPPPRVFSATAPQVAPAQGADGNFTQGAWDMWAPWLDGGIHPKLHDNADATPLVSIAAVLTDEVPASEAGLMRGAPGAAGPRRGDGRPAARQSYLCRCRG